MNRQGYVTFCVCLLLLTACAAPQTPPARTATSTPTAAATFTPTGAPAPTWTPTLTATPTPIPPLVVNITWPAEVSALEPPLLSAEVTLPQGSTANVAIQARIFDPAKTITTFDLIRQDNWRYVAPAPFQLTLDTPAGHWWLIVHVETDLDVIGERVWAFQSAPLEFHTLTETLPAGVNLRLPLAFTEVAAQGDAYAGGRVWRYGNGEVALWWAPGPTEPLLFNNAVVMLEATHDPGAPPAAEFVEETTWQERTAFLFQEQWAGRQGGPAKVWIIQKADFWLYTLRIRAVGSEMIPPLLEEIATTFAFAEE
jgi:hypothetical protein